MIRSLAVAALAGLAATPTLAASDAAGDAASGATVFKQCQSCHLVAAPDGTVLAGKAAKAGPNLYGIVGRAAGSYPDFKYSDSLVAAGAKGLVWDEEQLVKYLADPTAYLKEYLDDSSARSKMSFKLKKEQDARDMVAYLVSLAPPAQ
jgi:cytochrome c